MSNAEYHVASFVVHALPDETDTVTTALTALEGVEVHGENAGKIVVTAEAENVRQLADLTDSIQTLDAVVAVAPVYHEYSEAGDAPPRDR